MEEQKEEHVAEINWEAMLKLSVAKDAEYMKTLTKEESEADVECVMHTLNEIHAKFIQRLQSDL